MEKKRILVTSALPYANGPLHIGHLAGAYLPADIYVRYQRMMNREVLFVCGSDEHGAAITVRAMKDNTTPQAIVDKYHTMLKDTFEKIGISFDIYHRTSAELHHHTSQDFFRKLNDTGAFTEEESLQYYDEVAGQFLADRYIVGTCPICSNTEAYGDQCEKCGTSLSPNELIDPRSALSGAKPIKKSTKHWYLRLDQSENWLRTWINEGTIDNQVHHLPNAWKNHVTGQCNSWLDQGLLPRAMTRDLDWGVDVPQELDGAKGKKLYVWLDAPIGYISATKQWAADNQQDWKKWWQDDETQLLHFIGKDNIVFHCLIFPAILKAHGDFILPTNVPANQFMNLEGRKLSTSKNWAVWVHEYVEDFEGSEDVLRYNMIKNMPEQRDSEFTWKGFQETNNNELVNNLANFIHRVTVLVHKYYLGAVPDFDADLQIFSGFDGTKAVLHEQEMMQIHQKIEALGQEIDRFNFREAANKLMEISSIGNAMLQANEPWKTYKTEPEKVKVVLNLGLQIVGALAYACRPFLPFTSDKILQLLRLHPAEEKGELLAVLNDLATGALIVPAHHTISQPVHLFSRIPDEVIEVQMQKLVAKSATVTTLTEGHGASPTSTVAATALATAPATPQEEPTINYPPLKEIIAYDDFAKLDIRVGTIISAEKLKKSKKLLQLTIDLGFEKRTILSGIAEQFLPEEVVGKKVLVLANLAPRKMAGVESEGMVLMAENAAGVLTLVSPVPDGENGSEVR